MLRNRSFEENPNDVKFGGPGYLLTALYASETGKSKREKTTLPEENPQSSISSRSKPRKHSKSQSLREVIDSNYSECGCASLDSISTGHSDRSTNSHSIDEKDSMKRKPSQEIEAITPIPFAQRRELIQKRINMNMELSQISATRFSPSSVSLEVAEPVTEKPKTSPTSKSKLEKSKSSPNRRKLKIKKIKYFGGKIANIVEEGSTSIPEVLEMLLRFIENHGIGVCGIYRENGSSTDIAKLKTTINEGKPLKDEYLESLGINVVCGVVKCFFRELEEKLIPLSVLSEYQSKPEDERIVRLFSDLKALPESHKVFVKRILRHLELISSNSSTNMMTNHNLGIVFGPTLVASEDSYPYHTSSLIECVLDNLQLMSESEERVERQYRYPVSRSSASSFCSSSSIFSSTSTGTSLIRPNIPPRSDSPSHKNIIDELLKNEITKKCAVRAENQSTFSEDCISERLNLIKSEVTKALKQEMASDDSFFQVKLRASENLPNLLRRRSRPISHMPRIVSDDSHEATSPLARLSPASPKKSEKHKFLSSSADRANSVPATLSPHALESEQEEGSYATLDKT